MKLALITVLSLFLTSPAGAQDASKPAPAGKPFPTAGLLPKGEIGALRFLEAHPRYDGRGTIVAVLDTGIDPGTAGLQLTSDGKPKIIDMVDGTGSGDVDTSEVRKPEGDTLEGLSGRKLKLNPEWLKQGCEFHVGLKRGFDFMPRLLVERVKKERAEKFDAQQQALEEQLRRELAAFETAHPRVTKAGKVEKDELKARLEQLLNAGKEYEDPGPLYDCVVFHDGRNWRAVVDTNEDGDLSREKALTNYREEHQYATFGGGTEFNFAVNIYDQGRRLSLVAVWDAHGTHVAGIVAANFPEQPEFNGVAPGAQLVSVKIGDSRLGGMETVRGMTRGLKTVLDNHCDLINMSFGEATSAPNHGRLIELFTQVVDERGVIFVAAAGNDGPALSSVIAPGGTTSAVLGVGAYVSPEMAAVEYSLRHATLPLAYPWTSRGPAFDGDLGVKLLAPGGAISPVPTWTLNRHQQMNGTSMASPNACGAAALLVAGLKAEKLRYSPYSVRRALENTADRLKGIEVLAQGAGLIQVDRAFEYLTKHATAMGEQVCFRVEVTSHEQSRGIYLREPYETRQPSDHTLKIEPQFPPGTENATKLAFELQVVLEATAPWVQVGEAVLLNTGGRSLTVQVVPAGLEPGVHFAEVFGYDAGDRERGPLFRLPVTVIICHNTVRKPGAGTPPAAEPPRRVLPAATYKDTLQLQPGAPERRFLAVPYGATSAQLKLTRLDHGEPGKLFVHALERIPDQAFTRTDAKHFPRLAGGEHALYTFPVDAARTLEVCTVLDWTNSSGARVAVEVKFQGLLPDNYEIVLPTGQTAVRVELHSTLHKEVILPKATLTKRRTLVAPSHETLRPLDPERDRLLDGKQRYELLLTYEFQLEKAAQVTLRFPHSDELLYDSPYGGRLWMLFDAQKRRLAAGGVSASAVPLEEGKYTVLMPLRHDNPSVLQALRKTVMYVEQPLPKAIPVRVFPSRAAAIADARELTEKTLQAGEQIALYFRAPAREDVPAEVKPGDWLLGTVSFDKEDASEKINSHRSTDGTRAGRYRLLWGGPPTEKILASKSKEDGTGTHRRKPSSKLADEIRDLEIAELEQLPVDKDDAAFDELAKKLLEKYPNHLSILAARLHRKDHRERRLSQLPAIVQAADDIIAQLSQAVPEVKAKGEDDPGEKAAATPAEARELLAEALYRKGLALADMELPEVLAQHPLKDREAQAKAFEKNFADLQKLADTTEEKYAWLHARRELRHGRYGQALVALNKCLDAAELKVECYQQRRQLYILLGWEHLAEAEAKWIVLRFPKDFEPL